MKKNATAKALIMSVLALMLCLSMLVGTTFAWFTDSVKSGVNKIVAGNLDVELSWSADGNTWERVTADTDMFKDTLWEPGYTRVVYLKVENVGSLALKYKFGINVAANNYDAENQPIDLSQYIKFDVVEAESKYETRDAARDAVKDTAKLISAGYASEEGHLKKGATSKMLALVVYMPEDVGNEANHETGKTAPSIDLGINLVATQDTVEEDSFGNNYDAGVVMVTDVEELKAALSKGAPNVVLMEDMEIDETINITKDVNIDLNGKTILNDVPESRIFFVTEPNVTLTINGTEEGSSICASEADGKTYGIVDMREGSAGSKLVVNGGTYTVNTDYGALFKIRDKDVAVELNNVTAKTNYWVVDSFLNTGITLAVNGGHFESTQTVNGNNTYSVFSFSAIPDGDKPNVTFTDTSVVSAGGACIELNAGIGEFNNCNFTVTKPANPGFTASAMSVSGGGSAFINGGTYTSEGYGAYVYTSGGNIVVDGGAVISGKVQALTCSAASYYFYSGQITVEDGTINGDVYSYNDGDRPADIAINGGSVDGNFSTGGTTSATIHIYGGTFTNDPTAYVDNTISSVIDNGNGTWTVQ